MGFHIFSGNCFELVSMSMFAQSCFEWLWYKCFVRKPQGNKLCQRWHQHHFNLIKFNFDWPEFFQLWGWDLFVVVVLGWTAWNALFWYRNCSVRKSWLMIELNNWNHVCKQHKWMLLNAKEINRFEDAKAFTNKILTSITTHLTWPGRLLLAHEEMILTTSWKCFNLNGNCKLKISGGSLQNVCLYYRNLWQKRFEFYWLLWIENLTIDI